MSALMNKTNLGRVEKINDTLALIAKSAGSNNSSPEEIATLLQPVIDNLTPFLPHSENVGDSASDAGQGTPSPVPARTVILESGKIKDALSIMSIECVLDTLYLAAMEIDRRREEVKSSV